jgi:hypothetical protein
MGIGSKLDLTTIGRRAVAPLGLAVALGLAPMASAQQMIDKSIFTKHGDAIRPTLIAQTPNVYEGKVVYVEGDVDDIIGPNVFTLDDEEVTTISRSHDPNDGKDLIVVVPATIRNEIAMLGLKEGSELKVVGEVRRVTVAEVDDLGDMDDDVDVDLENRTVLVAQAIALDD